MISYDSYHVYDVYLYTTAKQIEWKTETRGYEWHIRTHGECYSWRQVKNVNKVFSIPCF